MAKRIVSDAKRSNFIHNKIGKMRVYDLQAACILRGLDFTDVVEYDFGKLSSWLIRNWDEKLDRELLEEFDIWVDGELHKKGISEDDPIRLYRKFSNIDEENEPKVKTRSLKKINVPKKKREKKERNTLGIFKGTKKEYTYRLVESLVNKFKDKYTAKELNKKYSNKLFQKVLKKFPDAKEKSVKIWMKRAIDGYNKQLKK